MMLYRDKAVWRNVRLDPTLPLGVALSAVLASTASTDLYHTLYVGLRPWSQGNSRGDPVRFTK